MDKYEKCEGTDSGIRAADISVPQELNADYSGRMENFAHGAGN